MSTPPQSNQSHHQMRVGYNTRFKRFCIYLLNILGRILYGITGGWLSNEKYDGEIKKILIIELWGIGDLVMMSTILRPLRKKYPKAKITLFSKSTAKNLFKTSQHIDDFVIFDFPWTKFKGKYKLWQWNWQGIFNVISQLRKEHFDLILDARGDLRNNFLTYFIGGKRRIGYDWLGGGYFLTDLVVVDSNRIHRIEAWKAILNHLGIDMFDARPFLHISDAEHSRTEEILREKGIHSDDLVIGVHPGARNKARRWPLEQFEYLINYVRQTYDVKIIFFISPDGYGENMPEKENVYKVKLSLEEMIALLEGIDLLICHDGGAMHVATAVNTPLIALFGPTNPVWFSPYGDNNTVIIKDHVKCRPCFDYCRYREPYCITTITVNDLLTEVDRKIESLIDAREAKYSRC